LKRQCPDPKFGAEFFRKTAISACNLLDSIWPVLAPESSAVNVSTTGIFKRLAIPACPPGGWLRFQPKLRGLFLLAARSCLRSAEPPPLRGSKTAAAVPVAGLPLGPAGLIEVISPPSIPVTQAQFDTRRQAPGWSGGPVGTAGKFPLEASLALRQLAGETVSQSTPN